jgi:acetylornithine deacetylase/succinyl-diaminopimelate desuccinylase-like protein
MSLSSDRLKAFIRSRWEASILPTLQEYIRIPNVSPDYDDRWQEHGHMTRAVKLLSDWISAQEVSGLTQEIVSLPGETPVLFIEIQGTLPETVLLYGHLDKQPPLDGWREGLHPFEPIMQGDRLYGRGAADDGYATFSAITAIKGLQEQSVPHPRCVVIIEACEESGSYNLPKYIELLSDRIGQPSLIVCLDSGCGDYERLWLTSSLRGVVGGVLRVEVLKEGVHSGDASGIVPSSFRIARHLLSRIEDPESGKVLLPELWTHIPSDREANILSSAEVLGEPWVRRFPFAGETRPVPSSVVDAVRARTWEPVLSVTGADGFPPAGRAGNVLRPFTALKLSMRIPPGVDPHTAVNLIKATLERDVPYQAHVTFTPDEPCEGWNAPQTSPELSATIREASQHFFGNAPAIIGEGGSIPFMAMLGKKFPQAAFVITGLLGPESNAHGPNEFLHIPGFKNITACVAFILSRMN